MKRGAYLHEEPSNMLKAELREVNVYNSTLNAIANGRNREAQRITPDITPRQSLT